MTVQTDKERVLSPSEDFADVTLKRSPSGGLTVDVSEREDIDDVTVDFGHITFRVNGIPCRDEEPDAQRRKQKDGAQSWVKRWLIPNVPGR